MNLRCLVLLQTVSSVSTWNLATALRSKVTDCTVYEDSFFCVPLKEERDILHIRRVKMKLHPSRIGTMQVMR
jgi:hypothetical protein